MGRSAGGADEIDFVVFDLLAGFADYINKLYDDDAIRLQELKNTEVGGDLSAEGPRYGRRYEVYHNRCKIGLVEICSGLFENEVGERQIEAQITIDGIPPTMLPYDAIRGFFITFAGLLSDSELKS